MIGNRIQEFIAKAAVNGAKNMKIKSSFFTNRNLQQN